MKVPTLVDWTRTTQSQAMGKLFVHETGWKPLGGEGVAGRQTDHSYKLQESAARWQGEGLGEPNPNLSLNLKPHPPHQKQSHRGKKKKLYCSLQGINAKE